MDESTDKSTKTSKYFDNLTAAVDAQVVQTPERGNELQATRQINEGTVVFTEGPIAAHQHQSNSWSV